MKNKYVEGLIPEIREYFKVLSKDFPDFLTAYIYTKEMQRIGKTGCACGTDYTKLYNHKFFYSNLEHSVAVALIIWNFTKDKKQTLAGLFHDISTPTFKHCVDFMNGDTLTQESTEEETEDMIRNSKEIMELLKKDEITLDEVKDYHIYPIADNDTPKLSADRLEYTFTNGIYFKEVWDIEKIREIYENIAILENEEKIKELGFKSKEVAQEFVDRASQLWSLWRDGENKFTLQFFADVLKEMKQKGFIQISDLYNLSEVEVLQRIRNCGDRRIQEAFQNFQNTTKVYESDEKPKDKYCVSVKAKKRYIIPLVDQGSKSKRIDEISEKAKQQIEEYLKFETKKYIYADFDF